MSHVEDNHQMCRVFGHAWEVLETAGWAAIRIRCIRCLTVREDRANPWTGDLEKRQYAYEDGYLRSKTDTSPVPTRADFRLRLMKRLDPDGTGGRGPNP